MYWYLEIFVCRYFHVNFWTDLHHVSRLHLTDLPSGSPRPNLLDETEPSSSSTSAALSSAASASCHQQTSWKLRPRNRFELFTLHESRCVEMFSCWENVHVKFKISHVQTIFWQMLSLEKNMHALAACFPSWSTNLMEWTLVQTKVASGDQDESWFWACNSCASSFSPVDSFLLFQHHVFSCVFLHSFRKVRPIEISLRLIWIGIVAAVAALALAAVTFWRCQARKKDGYLASNRAACRSFLDFQSKRCVKRYLTWRKFQCQFAQWDHVSTELFLILVMWEFTALKPLR